MEEETVVPNFSMKTSSVFLGKFKCENWRTYVPILFAFLGMSQEQSPEQFPLRLNEAPAVPKYVE